MSLNGVKFGNKHSYNDWGLVLRTRPIIEPPEPKTVYIDIPEANGSLDLTQFLTGNVCYKMRKIKFEFNVMSERSTWNTVYSTIMHHLHGKRMRIVFDEETNLEYIGRCEVTEWKSDKRTSIIKIEALVDPFKYELSTTVETKTAEEFLEDNVFHLRVGGDAPVIPTITCTKSVRIFYENKYYTLVEGVNINPFLTLKPDKADTGFTVIEPEDGVFGDITVEYQEGYL